jgi:hypothetical protein
LFQATWDALYPSILGCSTTVYMSTFDAGIGQIRGELNSYYDFYSVMESDDEIQEYPHPSGQ